VADLSTRAVRDGDEWVVNGQKVWTSMAHRARWGLLLARTDPNVPKHQGLTFFVVDMKAPGVEVRPLRQMTGGTDFNEVYFTDARIPDSERLGEEGEGWKVAMTTLTNERVYIGGKVAERGSGFISDALAIWRERGYDDPVKRNELTRLWIRAEVLRLTSQRARENRKAGAPGPEGSIGKLVNAELNQEITNLAMDLLGAEGTLYGSYSSDPAAGPANGLARRYLRSLANSIEGGTSEIMRNILGERVLGLPGDVRTDRTAPWSELPHG
jgi:alkylation response protein AidB-like acyl-CoA dehydrogenase